MRLKRRIRGGSELAEVDASCAQRGVATTCQRDENGQAPEPRDESPPHGIEVRRPIRLRLRPCAHAYPFRESEARSSPMSSHLQLCSQGDLHRCGLQV